MSSSKASKTLSVLALLLLSALAGCGEGSEAPAPRTAPAAQGSSFDAPVAKAPQIERREESATPPAAPQEAPNPSEAAPSEPKAVSAPSRAVEAPAPAPSVPEPEPKPNKEVTKEAPKEAAKEATKDGNDEAPKAITFATLSSFRYSMPRGRPQPGEKLVVKSQIPDFVRALDGKKVTIEGYMIPMDFQKGKILSFLLSKAMFGCCYADSPGINEVIKVVPADGKPLSYQTLPRVTGTLEVGEEFDADGFLDSIYRIKADTVIAGKVR